jgi:DUF1365 family protein
MVTNPKIVFSYAAISLLMFFTKPAYAYIDPGTGSMMIQAVIAGIAAASVSIGIFWKRIKLFLSRISGRKQKEEPNQDEKREA